MKSSSDFGTSVEFVKTWLYYCKLSKKFSLQKVSDSSILFPSIKKWFTVLDQKTISVEGKEFQVEYLLKEFLKLLMTSCTFPKKGEKNCYEAKCFIFTVPTDTDIEVKRRFKKIAHEVIGMTFLNSSIGMSDVYIIEEYSLLLHLDDSSSCIVVDVGCLTSDSIVKKDEKIIQVSGETRGISLIHEKIKKMDSSIDTMMVMKALFNDRDSDKLPEQYSNLESCFTEGVAEIAEPILDVILQYRCKNVIVCGGFVSHAYFRKLVEEYISVEKLEDYVNRQKDYLKDEFKDYSKIEFTTCCNPDGGSSLLNGVYLIIKKALGTSTAQQLDFERETQAATCRIGFAYFDTSTSSFCFDICYSLFDAYLKQDTEIFIIKFRNTIDIDKVENCQVTKQNYKSIGIMEFERFCSLEIIFKNPIELFRKGFFIHGKLLNDHVVVIVHYQLHNHFYYCQACKIPRKGRKDRIPINDIEKVFSEENDWDTWYGTPYYVEMNITNEEMIDTYLANMAAVVGEKDLAQFKSLERGELTSLATEENKKKKRK
ncbi:predicted protein [Naegleria gruberi]|uniref:Predicted protein n=1 Tax=Naegleria gruberi TaxID=5762 RepID=D2VTH6_NAEGR|nr:uncharacterized protein NAEGRDRAFT_72305 [Naegleria gruberi]EFC39936.1 predicted protein [Naegleria gruberi]|eukprot:XP_002672680.1 predicted protein [Naegleria gruberi strain NEG-M]